MKVNPKTVGKSSNISPPRILVAGLSGGSGKTILSLGLLRHWTMSEYLVSPFKKGPDYIDAVWMSRAAEHTASNLDPFLMSEKTLQSLFFSRSSGFDLAFIEGNRGLFDGQDVQGKSSTASLARLLDCPILLIIDCTKMTRTVAAILQGCLSFEPQIDILGVVLNRTSGKRHRNILRQCIETYTDVPVFGAMPRLEKPLIPERHMGLISDQEYEADRAIEDIAGFVQDWVDTEEILKKVNTEPRQEVSQSLDWPPCIETDQQLFIGVVKDTSLWFYYPENLEALKRAGAEIIELSLSSKEPWPEIQGLYLGGGFPETQAEQISKNHGLKQQIYSLCQNGLPVYAECGGLMYLCTSLEWGQDEFPMVGIFPYRAQLLSRPQGHGYTEAEVISDNPFHVKGTCFRGHEFHYSRCCYWEDIRIDRCLRLNKGVGIENGQDGLLYRNTFASYTHIHALSVPDWAINFVQAADIYKYSMKSGYHQCPDIWPGLGFEQLLAKNQIATYMSQGGEGDHGC